MILLSSLKCRIFYFYKIVLVFHFTNEAEKIIIQIMQPFRYPLPCCPAGRFLYPEKEAFMKITEFETWWVNRDKCLFDAKRQGGALMNWDVIVIRIGTDAGIDGIATCLAARSGGGV